MIDHDTWHIKTQNKRKYDSSADKNVASVLDAILAPILQVFFAFRYLFAFFLMCTQLYTPKNLVHKFMTFKILQMVDIYGLAFGQMI